ncbi:hypothetical protein ABQE46_13020 [Mycobacteroides chelonae]
MIPCASCGHIVMRPMGGDICRACRRDPFTFQAFLLLIAVGLILGIAVAGQSGWL